MDFLKSMPAGSVDAVVTDPPYDGYDYDWKYVDMRLFPQWLLDLPWICFWSGSEFPLPWSARHIWSKANRNIGIGAEQYEEIYERNGGTTGLVFRHAVIDSTMNAQLNSDIFTPHPTQKPIKLMGKLVRRYTQPGATVFDPFMGSGTTGVACVRTGRNFIGCELDEGYFKIAQRRIAEAQLQPPLFPHEATAQATQAAIDF